MSNLLDTSRWAPALVSVVRAAAVFFLPDGGGKESPSFSDEKKQEQHDRRKGVIFLFLIVSGRANFFVRNDLFLLLPRCR